MKYDFIRIAFLNTILKRLSLNALTEDGSKHSTMDETTASGFTPAYVAEQTYNAHAAGKEEIVIAQAKAHLAIALKAYMPSLLSRIMKRRARKAE